MTNYKLDILDMTAKFNADYNLHSNNGMALTHTKMSELVQEKAYELGFVDEAGGMVAGNLHERYIYLIDGVLKTGKYMRDFNESGLEEMDLAFFSLVSNTVTIEIEVGCWESLLLNNENILNGSYKRLR